MGHIWPRRHSRLGHHPRHRIHLSVHRSSAAGWRNGRHSKRQPWRFGGAAWNVQSAVPYGLLFWSRRHQFARPLESLRGWSSCKCAADEITQRGGGRPYFLATSLQDGVYGLGINLLVSGQGNSRRYIGNQPSVGVYWNAGRHLSVSTAYAHFLVGTFLAKASPPGRDVDYATVWTTYKF